MRVSSSTVVDPPCTIIDLDRVIVPNKLADVSCNYNVILAGTRQMRIGRDYAAFYRKVKYRALKHIDSPRSFDGL